MRLSPKEAVFLLPGYSALLFLRSCTWAPAIHIASPLTTLLRGKQALDFSFYQRRNCGARTSIHRNNPNETGGCSSRAENDAWALVFGSYLQSMDFIWLRAGCEWPTHWGRGNLGPELAGVWGRGVPTAGVESRIVTGHRNRDPIIFVTSSFDQTLLLYPCCLFTSYCLIIRQSLLVRLWCTFPSPFLDSSC